MITNREETTHNFDLSTTDTQDASSTTSIDTTNERLRMNAETNKLRAYMGMFLSNEVTIKNPNWDTFRPNTTNSFRLDAGLSEDFADFDLISEEDSKTTAYVDTTEIRMTSETDRLRAYNSMYLSNTKQIDKGKEIISIKIDGTETKFGNDVIKYFFSEDGKTWKETELGANIYPRISGKDVKVMIVFSGSGANGTFLTDPTITTTKKTIWGKDSVNYFIGSEDKKTWEKMELGKEKTFKLTEEPIESSDNFNLITEEDSSSTAYLDTGEIRMTSETDKLKAYNTMYLSNVYDIEGTDEIISLKINGPETKWGKDIIKYYFSEDGTTWHETGLGTNFANKVTGRSFKVRIIFAGSGGKQTYITNPIITSIQTTQRTPSENLLVRIILTGSGGIDTYLTDLSVTSIANYYHTVKKGGGSTIEHDFVKYPELTNTQINKWRYNSPHKQITESFYAKVVKVTDGDTIRVKAEFRDFDFPIRFLDIDSLEMNEGGEEAKAWVTDRLLNEEVQILIDSKLRVDKWGRLLGRVFHRGMITGEEMLHLGLAVPFGRRQEGEIPNFKGELHRWD